ncbi:MAG TPA: thiamine pyrophosphate-dependent enzyme [Thermoleophilia bacterium]|jgi:pyruvate ferredoxin oxidoreductase beta subunit|nr:thiamine pyrophosphate-dependent enzyme [Thermoleophilia bacterium]
MNERTQGVKFYQVGSFAVGNRLLEPDRHSAQADAQRANSLISGHRACQGCGEVLGARYVLDAAMRATGGKLIAVNATGCLEVVSTPYPESAWRMPWLHSLFGNAPAVASGVAAALKAQGHTDVRVVGQAGDGGAVDIGLGALSGMFERDDDVLFVCYDNQAYMNTGVQRSGATPGGARTATTPVVTGHPGNRFGQGKDVPAIAMAHRVPYVATATVADLRDLEAKVERAMQFTGARYLHVLVPCPLGWGAASSQTVRLARLATESGLFPLFEAEYGEVTAVTPIRHPVPVDEYLRGQTRYAHLFDDDGTHGGGDPDIVARIQAGADHNIRRYGLLADPDQSARGRIDLDEGVRR